MKPKKRTKLNPLVQFSNIPLSQDTDKTALSNSDSIEVDPYGTFTAFVNLLNILENKGCYSMLHSKHFTKLESKSIEDNVQILFGLIHVIWLESIENRSVNDRGELNIDDDIDYKNSINLSPIRTMTIGCPEDLEKIQSFPYVYINSINAVWVKTLGEPFHGLELQFMECNLRKKKVTFTISEELMDKFNVIADKLAINKSKFVENKIKEVIESYK